MLPAGTRWHRRSTRLPTRREPRRRHVEQRALAQERVRVGRCGDARPGNRALFDSEQQHIRELGALGPVHGHHDGLARLDGSPIDCPHGDVALPQPGDDTVSLGRVRHQDRHGLGGVGRLHPPLDEFGGLVQFLGQGRAPKQSRDRPTARRPVVRRLLLPSRTTTTEPRATFRSGATVLSVKALLVSGCRRAPCRVARSPAAT